MGDQFFKPWREFLLYSVCVFPLSSTPGSLPRWGSACQAGRGCDDDDDDENDNIEDKVDIDEE